MYKVMYFMLEHSKTVPHKLLVKGKGNTACEMSSDAAYGLALRLPDWFSVNSAKKMEYVKQFFYVFYYLLEAIYVITGRPIFIWPPQDV